MSIAVLWPGDNLELFDTPYLDSYNLASFLPGRFALGSGLLDVLFDVRTEKSHVGVGNVNLGFFEHCC